MFLSARLLHRIGVGFAVFILTAGCESPLPPPGATRISDADGMTLIYVPAGEFAMGSRGADRATEPDEMPAHTVYMDAFWIDRTEVTNAMYLGCIRAGECTEPSHTRRYADPAFAHHPIVGVTWGQAQAYCQWAGRRLPTEAEWEKAARGADGRIFPWGNDEPTASRANFGGLLGVTSAAGSFPNGASPYGALDMAGNVWEWVADGYDPDFYQVAGSANPVGPETPNRRVLRGGAWNVEASAVRAVNRFWAFPGRNDTDGFRCAKDG